MFLRLLIIVMAVGVTGCATAPKTCTPLTGGYDLVSSYNGECLRLSYHGEDLSGKCSAMLFVNERKKNRLHSIVFQTKSPRGIVSFNGVPHRKTSKIYYVTVNKVVRSEGHPIGNEDRGVCDVEILPEDNIRVICSAKGSNGKMSLGEFKTSSRKLISCMEQFPDFRTKTN